eukprot:scaffold91580_cov70-Cyclotella_meneghiniana.AAC.1
MVGRRTCVELKMSSANLRHLPNKINHRDTGYCVKNLNKKILQRLLHNYETGDGGTYAGETEDGSI